MVDNAEFEGNVFKVREWDDLIFRHGSAFQNSSLLDAIALGWPGLKEVRRVCAYQRGKLVAAAPALTYEHCPRLDYYRQSGSSPFESPCIISHSFVGWEGFPVSEDVAALQQLLHLFDELAKQDGQAILFTGIPEDRQELLTAMKQHGYEVRWFHTTMQQTVTPDHADDRVMYLPRKQRDRVRNALSKCRRSSLRIVSGPSVDEEQVRSIYARQMASLQIAPDVLSDSFLKQVFAQPSKLFEMHGAFLPCGRLVGHAVCMAWGERYYYWLAAYDAEVASDLPISSAMCVHVLQAAYRRGASIVDAGRSPYEFKRRHGFRPMRLMAAVRSQDAHTQTLANTWLRDLESRHILNYPELQFPREMF